MSATGWWLPSTPTARRTASPAQAASSSITEQVAAAADRISARLAGHVELLAP